MEQIVILGAGHAGFQCAAALRQQGFGGAIVLVGNEGVLPYQRPPLSKAYLVGKTAAADLGFRPERFFADQRIELRNGHAEAIDRAQRRVVLRDGTLIPYDHLVLALGSQPRTLPVPGADLAGVLPLQTLQDADRLRAALKDAANAVVIGAGFIGLEFAASARALGVPVQVVDIAERPMARVLSAECGAVFAQEHQAQGTALLWQTGVHHLEGEAGRVTAVVTSDGRRLPADVVLVGIGAAPRTALAAQAGLEVENGVVVDADLLTADPTISAIGDIAAFPQPGTGKRIRLESVQNATDQARAVAARLTGKPAPYAAVPWFWSDQGALKLQIAGLRAGTEDHVVLGDPATRSFSVLCIADGVLRAVETVNRPGEHMLARKLLAKGVRVTPEQARGTGFELKALAG
jgi:3-phenylpropionate/trans-cinnamate dioxygenase ferredoxin reductase subunit